MSLISNSLRAAVTVRAGYRCEYCHLPTRGQVAAFPIDHVMPRTLEGQTILDNLALSCPRCNGSKWMHTEAVDVETGQSVPLFNPRVQVWSEHFTWSTDVIGVLLARTDCGRATLSRLQINSPNTIVMRQLLSELGLFPELLPVKTG